MTGDIRIESLSGDALAAVLPDLARLRIAVFRDFPYLYEGSPEYEQRYLATYVETPDSVVVTAFDGDRVVGAATALPLAHEPDDFTAPFAEALDIPVERLFYLAESVLQPAYRGRGIGVEFFRRREAHARRLGRFSHAVFCAVERPADHPRRPSGHVPLDDFWRRRGYEPVSGLTCYLSWRDLDEVEESRKAMRCWIRDLGR